MKAAKADFAQELWQQGGEALAWKGSDHRQEQRGLPAREWGCGGGVRMANYHEGISGSGGSG